VRRESWSQDTSACTPESPESFSESEVPWCTPPHRAQITGSLIRTRIFASFGSELDVTTQQILVRGERLVELLKQPPYKPMSLDHQLILLFAGRNGYLDKLTMAQVDDFKEFIND